MLLSNISLRIQFCFIFRYQIEDPLPALVEGACCTERERFNILELLTTKSSWQSKEANGKRDAHSQISMNRFPRTDFHANCTNRMTRYERNVIGGE